MPRDFTGTVAGSRPYSTHIFYEDIFSVVKGGRTGHLPRLPAATWAYRTVGWEHSGQKNFKYAYLQLPCNQGDFVHLNSALTAAPRWEMDEEIYC